MMKPMEIEKKSFEIITEELGDCCEQFRAEELEIVKRVIHTTADFEYADLICFSPRAVEKGVAALKKGCKVYADTKMIAAGINKNTCGKLHIDTVNYLSDEDVASAARLLGCTRSAFSIKKAVEEQSATVFAIGNAPTALAELIHLYEEGAARPELVIGVPVGFVGAAESKSLLMEKDIPYICIKGRKGGSTVAVAIMNALLYMIDNER